MNNTQGVLFIIVGPPGAGKNALMNAALQHDDTLRQLATATTRPRRSTEKEGREHLFVSPEQFRQMIADNELLEWQEVHADRFYGVPRQRVETALAAGENLIADIDVLGATYIRSLYPQHVVLIFIEPPSEAELKQRMRTRGDDEADINTRLERVKMEMAYAPVADYVVVNDDFEQTVARFRSIITTESACRRAGEPTNRHYSHQVVTLPVYRDSVLYTANRPHFPTCTLTKGEVPHQAALHSLAQTFGLSASADHLLRLNPNKGSFISPVQVEAQADNHTKHITFTYVYWLSERLQPGPGWLWRPLAEVDLPDRIRQLLHARQQEFG